MHLSSEIYQSYSIWSVIESLAHIRVYEIGTQTYAESC
jgi:hypothetical protein